MDMIRLYDCLESLPLESVREAPKLPLRGYGVESPSDQVLTTWMTADGSILCWCAKPRGDDRPWKLLKRLDGGRQEGSKDGQIRV